MNTNQKPLIELTEDALQILHRELGTADTIRFIRQFSTGFGNYTSERGQNDTTENLDELLEEIEARRDNSGTPKLPQTPNDIPYQERLEDIRKKYPRAYEKWTAEEDEQLRQQFLAGAKVSDLSKRLQRQRGAIEARLSRLGLTK